MGLKLQDIKQQASNEITAGCDRCDQSVISITEGVFRCFPGSESAVTYRALLRENCKISSIDHELRQAIERWLSSGRASVVQSLVLKADSSCPVIVGDVNDPECINHDVRNNPNSGITSKYSIYHCWRGKWDIFRDSIACWNYIRNYCDDYCTF